MANISEIFNFIDTTYSAMEAATRDIIRQYNSKINLIDDWSGMYRGYWKYENLEEFKKCLDALEFDLLGEDVSVNEEDKKFMRRSASI